MTEREYQAMLDVVDEAINADSGLPSARGSATIFNAANDNDVEWPLAPFPDGWTASP